MAIAPQLLIVEDDASLRQILTWFVEDLGCVVVDVADCATARQALHRQPFDLVLLDYRLPDGIGLDLLADLLEIQPGLAIIMVSAETGAHLPDTCQARGAAAYLRKPVESTRLAEACHLPT